MKKLKINLFNQTTIQQAIKELQEYKQDLKNKTELFCERLSKVGIDVIRVNLGNYAIHIGLRKNIEIEGNDCKAILILYDEHSVISEWVVRGDNGELVDKTAEISPVLMAEFGSGKNASAAKKHQNAVNVKEQVGRGTFPSENNKPFGNENHAWQNSWSWQTKDGKWHRSSGMTPTMPMYNAYLEMERQIKQIGKEIFKE